ncbi:MAG: hypothetical protein K5739_02715 [Lachnospiraceae bacterium]|nr:hypothetical protein [Lachnospiraceae bacterium]
MNNMTDDGNRAEQRKKRRRKERFRALAIVGGILVAAVLVLVLVIGGAVKLLSPKKAEGGKTEVSAKSEETESVADADDSASTDEAESDPEDSEDVDSEEGNSEEGDTSDSEDEDGDKESDKDSGKEKKKEPAEKVAGVALSEEELAALDEQITQNIAGMSLEEKIAKMFIVSPGQLIGTEIEPKSLGGSFSEKLSTYPVSGILIKPANIGTEEEFASFLSTLGMMQSNYMFLAVEEEGGEESPFVSSGITENVISSQKEVGESLGNAGAYSAGISIGGELKNYGINLDLAPTTDVSERSGSYAFSHGFGTDKATTVDLSKNMIRGLEDQGIFSVVKSFPGYGDVNGNGSGGTVSTQKTREQLVDMRDIYMESIKAGGDMLMISHVGVPKVRKDQRPASMSEEVITGIVREEWGYDGVVITDYLDRSCIYSEYTYADAAVGAVEAGADILLSTKNFQKSYDGLMSAVKSKKISEERIDESVRRIMRLLYQLEQQ